MKNVALILFCMLVSFNTNANLTPAELNVFKDSIKRGCIDRGIESKDKNAIPFCNCMDDIMRNNLTNEQYEEMAEQSALGKGPAQMPFFKALMPKMAACKKDVAS